MRKCYALSFSSKTVGILMRASRPFWANKILRSKPSQYRRARMPTKIRAKRRKSLAWQINPQRRQRLGHLGRLIRLHKSWLTKCWRRSSNNYIKRSRRRLRLKRMTSWSVSSNSSLSNWCCSRTSRTVGSRSSHGSKEERRGPPLVPPVMTATNPRTNPPTSLTTSLRNSRKSSQVFSEPRPKRPIPKSFRE